MEHDVVDKEITVQGVGTPVPARGESCSAGSLGSLSFDRNVEDARNQVRSLVTVTGTETSTARTSKGNTPYEWDDLFPPLTRQLSRSQSLDLVSPTEKLPTGDKTPKNIAFLDYTWNYEVGTSVKRKRTESSTPDEQWKKEITATVKLSNSYRKTAGKIENEIKNLSKLIRENVNTKRKIKESVNKLRSLSSAINTAEMQNLLQTLGRQHESTEQGLIISTLTEELQDRKDKEEQIVNELEECRLEKEQIANELHKIRADAEKLKKLLSITIPQDIPVDNDDIQKIDNFEEFKNLADREWLDDAFQITAMVEGYPQKTSTNQDLAVWQMAQREPSETSRQARDESKTPSRSETGKNEEKTTPRTADSRYMVLEWVDQNNQSNKKRRRADTDITPDTTKLNKRTMREKLITLLNKVDKETLQLYKMCMDNNNTKREIKDTAAILRSLMSQLMTREMQTEIATIGNEETPKTEEKKEFSGTCTRCKKDIQAEDNLKDKIKQMLDEATTFEEYWTAASTKWPEGVFSTTKITTEENIHN
ncbi:hypothetical protein FQR65_LT13414 [Abscondita terminalis]|nr:hypothetical protein FQR65_LT13414 [Abscondita terminalis]